MLRTQIYLPQKQLRSLKKIAAEEDISLSEAIRRLIEEKLRREKGSPKKTQNVGKWLLSLRQEAKRLKIRGPKDLASNLDKYLYGK